MQQHISQKRLNNIQATTGFVAIGGLKDDSISMWRSKTLQPISASPSLGADGIAVCLAGALLPLATVLGQS